VPKCLQARSPEDWLEYFRQRGYRDPRPLAAGVEGAVFDLGDGTVAKVWRQRPAGELTLMQAFYADLADASLPFATPEILAVEDRVRGPAGESPRRAVPDRGPACSGRSAGHARHATAPGPR
jgi:hypothetical protein